MNIINDLSKKKKLFFHKENFYAVTVIFLIFFLDRFSKVEIIDNFNEDIFYVNNLINFDLIWNTGIGFGILSFKSSLIYNGISTVIGIVILIMLYLTIISKKGEKIIFSIIIGGAAGNFYDRLVYNAVPDFIDLHYKDLHWFTFNVADIFITLGIITYIMKDFFIKADK